VGARAVDLAERVHSARVLDRLAPLGRAAAASGSAARDLAHRVAAVVAG
jgi:hypothetical protein